MRSWTLAFSLLLFVVPLQGATPKVTPDLPLFRIETAEVHIAFSALDKHQRPVTELQPGDFTVFRDGQELRQLQLQRREDIPIHAAVLTDVSFSMEKAVPMARAAWQWMDVNLMRRDDQLKYFDFGADVSRGHSPQAPHLTSLYDCLIKLIPQVSSNYAGRRSLILFTDGIDNNSVHAIEDVIRLAVSQDVAIYAISTWKYKINYDAGVLEKLTNATGGRFFLVKNTREMTETLADIAGELRNGYELIFRADKASTGLHRIMMQSTNRHIRFYHRAAYYQPPMPMGTLIASER